MINSISLLCCRLLLPVVCVMLIVLLVLRMLSRREPLSIARLNASELNTAYNISAAECLIGRGALCDVRLNLPSVSRRHAVLTFNPSFGFRITPVKNAAVTVNGIEVDGFAYLMHGDVIDIGGVKLRLNKPEFEDISSSSKRKVKSSVSCVALLITAQIIMYTELLIHYSSDFKIAVAVTIPALIAVEMVYFAVKRFRGIYVELIGFFLTTFGFAVAASAYPSSLPKQAIAAALGFGCFIIVGFIMKNIEIVMKLRYAAGAAAIALFGYNLVFGLTIYGAKNWIAIGPLSLQPSEIIKFLFIFATAATLEHLFTTRNYILFLGFSGACVGSLVLMRDFGTALIYFSTVLIVIFMRSGDIRTIIAISGAAAAGAFAVIQFVPYVHNRFAHWLHAWDYASDAGFQQTRTMIAVASGGLFGLGGGEGNLDTVAAADTDLVFGILCEEWGIICAFCAVACFVIYALYVMRCTKRTRSSYYAIASAAAAGLWLVQISLNIFGSVDLLPLTGVTLPFISNGGSSMISSWLLLSLLNAAGEQTLGRSDES